MMLSEEFERTLATQIIMLSPLTPHYASELWAGFCSVAASPSINKVTVTSLQDTVLPLAVSDNL